ncbi:hypothetical protein ACLQ3C_00275 [Gordonia sp. DT30]|uniref:hypothetical protein n=1 Tax=Gordonia sp. DT30 TaxID=3416546 RepID=UPI003CFB3F97
MIGWRPGFLLLAATGALVAVLSVVVVSDGTPAMSSPATGDASPTLLRRLRESLAEPGTRLAFWTHFVTPFSSNTFGVLWGFPFLVAGEGLQASGAQAVLVTTVVVGVVAGPVMGVASVRFAAHRMHLVLGLVACQFVAWAVVLAVGDAPTWMLFAVAIAIGIGGPASIVAFDFVREHNPAYRLSTATGIVNAGGFTASVMVILLIGLTLNLTSGPGGAYDLSSFRIAMCWQIPFWALGALMVVREHRRTRARTDAGDRLSEVTVRSLPR